MPIPSEMTAAELRAKAFMCLDQSRHEAANAYFSASFAREDSSSPDIFNFNDTSYSLPGYLQAVKPGPPEGSLGSPSMAPVNVEDLIARENKPTWLELSQIVTEAFSEGGGEAVLSDLRDLKVLNLDMILLRSV